MNKIILINLLIFNLLSSCKVRRKLSSKINDNKNINSYDLGIFKRAKIGVSDLKIDDILINTSKIGAHNTLQITVKSQNIANFYKLRTCDLSDPNNCFPKKTNEAFTFTNPSINFPQIIAKNILVKVSACARPYFAKKPQENCGVEFIKKFKNLTVNSKTSPEGQALLEKWQNAQKLYSFCAKANQCARSYLKSLGSGESESQLTTLVRGNVSLGQDLLCNLVQSREFVDVERAIKKSGNMIDTTDLSLAGGEQKFKTGLGAKVLLSLGTKNFLSLYKGDKTDLLKNAERELMANQTALQLVSFSSRVRDLNSEYNSLLELESQTDELRREFAKKELAFRKAKRESANAKFAISKDNPGDRLLYYIGENYWGEDNLKPSIAELSDIAQRSNIAGQYINDIVKLARQSTQALETMGKLTKSSEEKLVNIEKEFPYEVGEARRLFGDSFIETVNLEFSISGDKSSKNWLEVFTSEIGRRGLSFQEFNKLNESSDFLGQLDDKGISDMRKELENNLRKATETENRMREAIDAAASEVERIEGSLNERVDEVIRKRSIIAEDMSFVSGADDIDRLISFTDLKTKYDSNKQSLFNSQNIEKSESALKIFERGKRLLVNDLDNYRSLQDIVRDQNKSRTQLEADIAGVREEIATLTQETKRLRVEKDASQRVRAEVTRIRDDIARSIEDIMPSYRGESFSSVQALAAYRDEINQVRQEIISAREDLSSIRQRNTAGLVIKRRIEGSIAKAQARLEDTDLAIGGQKEFQKRYDRLALINKQLEAESSRSVAEQIESVRIREENEKLSQEITRVRQEILTQNAIILEQDRLNSELEAKQELSSASEAKAKNSELNQKVIELEAKLKIAGRSKLKVFGLKLYQNQLELALQQKQSEIGILEERLSESEARFSSENQRLKGELKKVSSRNASLVSELQIFKTDNTTLIRDLGAAKSALRGAQNQNTRISQEIAQKEARILELEGLQKTTTTTNERLVSEKISLESKIAALINQLESANQKQVRIKAEYDIALADSKSTFARKSRDKDAELESLRRKITTNKEQIRTLQMTNEDYLSNNSRLQQQLVELGQKKAEASKRAEALQRELDSSKSKLESTSNRFSQQSRKISRLEQQLLEAESRSFRI